MLALAASWGVYSFQRLFVPEFFAIVSAAAFELVYIGMALVMTPDKHRATAISLGAVGVSVVYNTLAGLFHRNPEWLTSLPVEAEIGLSVLHGLPLAGLAWVVADLLLHAQHAQIPEGSYSIPGNLAFHEVSSRVSSTASIRVLPIPQLEILPAVETEVETKMETEVETEDIDIVQLYEECGSIRKVGKALGVSHTTARNRLLDAGVNLERTAS
jgi:4-amino-4-deoxy-L-arabinose transferase-like glycosyltransferase